MPRLPGRAGVAARGASAIDILAKIREVDALMTPARQAFVREVHPQLLLARLSGRGRGVVEPKRTPESERVRLRLLRKIVPRFDPAAVRARLAPSRVARDNVIDAVACLLAARQIAKGEAHALPEGVIVRDGRGLRVEILR